MLPVTSRYALSLDTLLQAKQMALLHCPAVEDKTSWFLCEVHANGLLPGSPGE